MLLLPFLIEAFIALRSAHDLQLLMILLLTAISSMLLTKTYKSSYMNGIKGSSLWYFQKGLCEASNNKQFFGVDCLEFGSFIKLQVPISTNFGRSHLLGYCDSLSQTAFFIAQLVFGVDFLELCSFINPQVPISTNFGSSYSLRYCESLSETFKLTTDPFMYTRIILDESKVPNDLLECSIKSA